MQYMQTNWFYCLFFLTVFGHLGCEPRIREEIIYEDPTQVENSKKDELGELQELPSSDILQRLQIELKPRSMVFSSTESTQHQSFQNLTYEITTYCDCLQEQTCQHSLSMAGEAEVKFVRLLDFRMHRILFENRSQAISCQFDVAVKRANASIANFHIPKTVVNLEQDDAELELQHPIKVDAKKFRGIYFAHELKDIRLSSMIPIGEGTYHLLCDDFISSQDQNAEREKDSEVLQDLGLASQIVPRSSGTDDPRTLNPLQNCQLYWMSRSQSHYRLVWSRGFQIKYHHDEVQGRLSVAPEVGLPWPKPQLHFLNWEVVNPNDHPIRVQLQISGSNQGRVFPVYEYYWGNNYSHIPVDSEPQLRAFAAIGKKNVDFVVSSAQIQKNTSGVVVSLGPKEEVIVPVVIDGEVATVLDLTGDNLSRISGDPPVCLVKSRGLMVALDNQLRFEQGVVLTEKQPLSGILPMNLEVEAINIDFDQRVSSFGSFQRNLFIGGVSGTYSQTKIPHGKYTVSSFAWSRFDLQSLEPQILNPIKRREICQK